VSDVELPAISVIADDDDGVLIIQRDDEGCELASIWLTREEAEEVAAALRLVIDGEAG
jgi:hypothetical protein